MTRATARLVAHGTIAVSTVVLGWIVVATSVPATDDLATPAVLTAAFGLVVVPAIARVRRGAPRLASPR